MSSGYVHLNVGETLYTSSKTTLTKYPDSMLAIMCSKEWEGSSATGTTRDNPITIDRSDKLFEHILEYLRNAQWFVFPNTELSFLMQLYVEAQFYGIDGLCDIIEHSYLQPREITVLSSGFATAEGCELILLRRNKEFLTRLAALFCLKKIPLEGDIYVFMNEAECSCEGRGRNIVGAELQFSSFSYLCESFMNDYKRHQLFGVENPFRHNCVNVDVNPNLCNSRRNLHTSLKEHLLENPPIRATVVKVYGGGPCAHVDVMFKKISLPDETFTQHPDRPIHMALSDFRFASI